jgi:serine/threonine protein kinase
LAKYIRDAENGLQTNILIASEMVKAVLAINMSGVIHNDIKSDNVIINNSSTNVTIIDFGRGCTVDTSMPYPAFIKLSTEQKKRKVVKYPFIDPDLILNSSTPSTLSDGYSVGLLLMKIGSQSHLGKPNIITLTSGQLTQQVAKRISLQVALSQLISYVTK